MPLTTRRLSSSVMVATFSGVKINLLAPALAVKSKTSIFVKLVGDNSEVLTSPAKLNRRVSLPRPASMAEKFMANTLMVSSPSPVIAPWPAKVGDPTFTVSELEPYTLTAPPNSLVMFS